ncbi:hypothetical protein V8G54_022643 [Vigna mungo]|uniref:Uncharacterized protein n=1 Tax=Vigna mungo TaxID=3915 RepID=A0AAQ3N3K9_VIGMU
MFIQGCLLRSLPGDVIFDNSSGFSFTCDLTDNIAAPWPSSSSMASLSLCAPGMFLEKITVFIAYLFFYCMMLILQNTVCICLTIVRIHFGRDVITSSPNFTNIKK